MYLDFHGFREKPFNLTPDPRFVFLSKHHREAFAHLLYGIHHRVGFIALTGEVGSGKTTVLRALLSQLDADHTRTALIFNPGLSAAGLLNHVNREFGIPADPSGTSWPLDDLNLFLLKENAAGRTVVLVIDEAQNLEAGVLEQIRLISNLETDREKLIQIVLSGQTELVQTLERREMRQISQRITVRYHLQPMDFEDTVGYINHRLNVAGGRNEAIFSSGALKRIYRYSGGLPRLINAACDRALLVSYTRDELSVSSRTAAAGIEDLKRHRAPGSKKRRLVLVPALILAAFFAAGIYSKWFGWRDLIDRFNPSPSIEATEGQTEKEPLLAGEELARAMAEEAVSEPESARRTFNALADRWNVAPLAQNETLSQSGGIERAALDRKLRVYRFSGNLGTLLRIDCPAALELAVPGIPGKRFVSLVGLEDGKLLVKPPVAGRGSLSFSEIEEHWSGQGYLFWRDSLGLLANALPISPGARGSHVKQLQGLLRDAGLYGKPLTGVYDEDTLSAVKGFQSSRGIEQDGIAGGQTLMILYRDVDRFEVPRLTVERK